MVRPVMRSAGPDAGGTCSGDCTGPGTANTWQRTSQGGEDERLSPLRPSYEQTGCLVIHEALRLGAAAALGFEGT